MSKYINAVKTELQIKRENKLHVALKACGYFAFGILFMASYHQPANAANEKEADIVINSTVSCFEFIDLQELDEAVDAELKEHVAFISENGKETYKLKTNTLELTKEDVQNIRNRIKYVAEHNQCE